MRKTIAGVIAGCALAFAGQALAQEKLTVWWVKGFYKSEDDALFAAIKKFEAKTRRSRSSCRSTRSQDMIPKTVAALDSGSPPDVAYADVYDFQVTAQVGLRRQARGRHQRHRSDAAPSSQPNTLETTFLYNDQTKTRAYYAFPIKQQTMHIQYWKDMLAEAGFKESDIPTTWKEYWSFWCDKVQPAYRQKTGNRAFGIGQPLGVDSSDSFYSFLTFMDAYNVKLVNDSGKLLVDDPTVRQGLINALTDYTAVYSKGCAPPSATSWKDPDNNVAFHNKTTVHDAQRDDLDRRQVARRHEQRDADRRSSARPRRRTTRRTDRARPASRTSPTARKMVYRAAVKTGVIFKDAKNKAAAKEFVAFLLDEANLTPYVEGSLGRWFPVTKAAQQSAFWKADPHRLAVYNQFMSRHGAVRIHQELQVHGAQQRERLGQGDEPHPQREGAGRQGDRRDDRPHQGGRGLTRCGTAARRALAA